MARKNKDAEETLSNLINWEKFSENINKLEPKDLCNVYLKLLEFVIPKKQSIAQDINTNIKDDAERLVESMLKINN